MRGQRKLDGNPAMREQQRTAELRRVG
jgi:hypothetical protein